MKYVLGYHHTNNDSVLQVKTYENDIVCGFRSPPQKNIFDGSLIQRAGIVASGGISNKADIKSFNLRSARRLKLTMRNASVKLFAMITLTYPAEFVKDGRITKKHLNTFLQWLRDTNNIKYIWVQEFQKRGAVHYHIAVNEFIHYEKIRCEWARIVTGDESTYIRTDIQRIKKSIESYFASYFRKPEQKKVPAEFSGVGRFWGCSAGMLVPVSVFNVSGAKQTINSALRPLKKWYQSKLRNLTRINYKTKKIERCGFKWSQQSGFTAWGGAVFKNIIETNIKGQGDELCIVY